VAVIFPERINRLLPAVLLLGPPVGAIAAILGIWYFFSPWYTDVGYTPDQPVEYSHELHAGQLGIDCRYCHNTVEVGAAAAVPSVDTCMNCHRVVLPQSELLEPVRTAASDPEASLEWVRVHMLPDYAYFDHSVHVAAGVGCVTCHGRIDEMPVVRQSLPLSMVWCWDCHKDPAPNLRPTDEVTNMTWTADASWDPHDRERFPDPPLHCSGCHR
jgi:hypothetical protein